MYKRYSERIKDPLFAEQVYERITKCCGSDYSFPKFDEEFVRTDSALTCVCKKHGEFTVTVSRILYKKRSSPCERCNRDTAYRPNRNTKDDATAFMKRFTGDTYEFPNFETEYRNTRSVLTCICKEHGEFRLSCYDSRRLRRGCPQCVTKHALTE